jgi:hypothetical protein
MNDIIPKTGKVGGVLTTLGNLPGQCSGKLRTKIATFDRKIAGFPQRRWS